MKIILNLSTVRTGFKMIFRFMLPFQLIRTAFKTSRTNSLILLYPPILQTLQ